MKRLEFHLLGKPAVLLDGAPFWNRTGWHKGKAAYLLARLAYEGPHRQHRLSKLIPQLFDDNDRGSVYDLRDRLAKKGLADLLWFDTETISLEWGGGTTIWVDVHEFRHLLRKWYTFYHQQRQVTEDMMRYLEAALALYRGDFLRGSAERRSGNNHKAAGKNLRTFERFQTWQQQRAEEHYAEAAWAVQMLVLCCCQAGQWERAVQQAEAGLLLDPNLMYDETHALYYYLIRMHLWLGKPAAAQANYDRYCRVVANKAPTGKPAPFISQLMLPDSHIAGVPQSHDLETCFERIPQPRSIRWLRPEYDTHLAETRRRSSEPERDYLLSVMHQSRHNDRHRALLQDIVRLELTLVWQSDEVSEVSFPHSQLLDYLDETFRQGVAIIGSPGTGKTTILLELGRLLFERAWANRRAPVPLILSLSTWPEKPLALEAWIIDEIRERQPSLGKVCQRLLGEQRVILLLDALDSIQSPSQRDHCIEQINAFQATYPAIPVILSCRQRDYEELSVRPQRLPVVAVQPLNDRQIQACLAATGNTGHMLRRLLKDPLIRERFRVPLILGMAVLAYQNMRPETFALLGPADDQHRHLFETYINRALDNPHPPYSRKDSQRYLTWLAHQMTARDQQTGQENAYITDFYIENLQPEWLPVEQRVHYKNITSVCIGVVGALMVAVPVGMGAGGMRAGAILGLIAFLEFMLCFRFTQGILFGVLWGGLAGVSIGIADNLPVLFGQATLQPVRSLLALPLIILFAALAGRMYANNRWVTSVHHIRPVAITIRLTSLRLAIIVAMSLGLLLVNSFVSHHFADSRAQVLSLVFILLACGLFYLITSFDNHARPANQQLQPNGAIHRSLHTALIIGGAAGLVGVSLSQLLLDAWGGLSAMMIGLGFGGYAVIQHGVLRYFLRRNGSIPPDYAHFLNYAAASGVLVRIGGGYQFIHDLVQQHLAARYQPRTDTDVNSDGCSILPGVGHVLDELSFDLTT